MERINILIVDDRFENIVALQALLESKDVNLITTTSPNEALRICWEKDIAIALVDVQMPEMDGFELVDILKSNPRTRDMLVIFVTAISKETKYAVKGLSAGAVDYLYKPLDPYLTSAKVDSFIQLVTVQREVKQKNIELENYQEELIKARDQAEQAKKVKENFLANMSHEIRTPINGILGLVHLLKNTTLDNEQESLINLLEVSSQSLLGVINDILDISKIDAGKFKIVRNETQIRKVAVSIIDLLKFKANEKKIKLEAVLDPRLPTTVMADSLRLNQILMNLLSNAIKFTEEGEVILSVDVLADEGEKIKVKFSVKDTGIGIAENRIDKIFESFEQAEDETAQKFGGTGLGLSIVKKLATLKGGTLEVESVEGRGSTFSFINTYQVVSRQEVEKKKGTDNDFEKFDSITVLLAEDNMINQFMIKKILSNWNIAVDAVDDGEKALQKLGINDYDLVLMDTHMPVMDGHEAMRRIRSGIVNGKEEIPIISLSANVMEEEARAATAAGATAIISKPIDLAALHSKIGELTKK
ncbi:response regulator [Rubrolithibacter danxiaensis]|uniref:response regulator n=1 Tax=Rubrolithibacter danxiaensis TaxID=3390805 RepID=UPI003BF8CF43